MATCWRNSVMASSDDGLFEEAGDYLLATQSWHDCHFLVGGDKERIGAVRCNLINQSRTWWSMLSPESPLAEKGDISLPDIEPDVFRLLLKHSYGGLEDCSALNTETVMELCYCASKYLMSSLMKKIAVRLQPSSVDQLFPALHCLAYYNLHDVEEAVRKIVQNQTYKIFKHPEFLECDIDSVTYIAKQDTLKCKEIELWRALVTWAKHRAQSEDGVEIRKWLLGPLHFVRLLTLSITDLRKEVFSQNIFNSSEFSQICTGVIEKNGSLCDETVVRGLVEPTLRDVVVEVKQPAHYNTSHYTTCNLSSSCILVKNNIILLKSITCKGTERRLGNSFFQNKNLLFAEKILLNIAVTVTRVTNHFTNTSDEEPVVIRDMNVPCGIAERFTFPTTVYGKGVLLKANSEYRIDLLFSGKDSYYMPCWSEPDCVGGHDFEHGTFHCSLMYPDGIGNTPCHIREFTYSVAPE